MSGVYGDDDEELESFDVTNDDLMNEFNPNRPMFRQTKEDALYGIWADQEKSGWSKFKKKSSKYSEPVNFISGGVKNGDGPSIPEDKMQEVEEDEKKTDDSGSFQKSEKVFHTLNKSSKSSNGSGSYSLASKGKKEKVDSQFASFERHTKGIGMKLLTKMGYRHGRGLGKGNQGIINPVEAIKRNKKAGLGSGGSERTKQSYIHFPTEDSAEEEEEEFKSELAQWRKGSEPKSRKPKYKYKTIEELTKSGKSLKKKKDASPSHTVPNHVANVKVIDMTGKEKKVFSGYHAIAGRVTTGSDVESVDEDLYEDEMRKREIFSCPELLHNLDTLIEETEHKILSADRQKRYESDRSVSLEHQRKKLEETLVKEESEINRIETVLRTISQCEERLKSDENCEILLNYFAEVFAELQEKYFAEYRMFELSDLASVMVHPLISKYLANWNPLIKPSYGINEMKRWKLLLELDKSSFTMQNVFEETVVFQHMMWEVWMPVVRSAIRSWDPHDAEPILNLIEQWMPILPAWMLDNLLTQLVLPQLQKEVDCWDPLTDPIPLHSWIHPWLPHMKERLEPLYGPIRHKLSMALQMWHPRDPSARIILEPWHKVFTRGSWDAFIIKTILPKLAKCMGEFIVDPRQQDLNDIECILSWKNLVPTASMVTILEKHFFPKWLKALSAWLNGSPDFEEVTQWYIGWKAVFPEPIVSNSFVKDRLKQALEMMDRAASGQLQKMQDYHNTYEHHEPAPDPPPKMAASSSHKSIPLSFKDLLQKRAEERGILFLQLPRSRDGQTLYKLGCNVIYIDKQVVFKKVAENFIPISLQELFDQ
uniref:Tuftelin-interacting protein 11 n=1 Tax=Ciona savignyi TaxID=51511 RepID=A1XDA6_CIOSA|nr:STIP [Ciona savignyi]